MLAARGRARQGCTLVDAAIQTRYGRVGVNIESLFDKHYVGYYSQSALAVDETATFAGRGRTLGVSWTQSF